jgi:circadian clock protein KaiC
MEKFAGKTKKIKKTEKREIKGKKLKDLKIGINGLDCLFKTGGIPAGSSILVEGGPGSGKSIFCLQLAYNACKQGAKVLYMSFEEPESRLRNHMKNFGWEPENYEKKGDLLIKRFNALDIARSVEALLSEAKKELLIDIQPVLIPKEFKPDIVCIDSLSAIASAFSGEESRFRIYMEQLFRYLERNNIISFLIREISNPTHIGVVYVEKGEAVSFLSDGIIVLYNVIYANGERGRAIEVLKMRGRDFVRRIVEADIINKKGFVIYPNKHLKGRYNLT